MRPQGGHRREKCHCGGWKGAHSFRCMECHKALGGALKGVCVCGKPKRPHGETCRSCGTSGSRKAITQRYLAMQQRYGMTRRALKQIGLARFEAMTEDMRLVMAEQSNRYRENQCNGRQRVQRELMRDSAETNEEPEQGDTQYLIPPHVRPVVPVEGALWEEDLETL